MALCRLSQTSPPTSSGKAAQPFRPAMVADCGNSALARSLRKTTCQPRSTSTTASVVLSRTAAISTAVSCIRSRTRRNCRIPQAAPRQVISRTAPKKASD
jgi:hypothetical protein